MNRLTLLHRRVRRAILARRRLIAALAAAAAVATGFQAAAEPPPPKTWVLTAARDLPGGSVVRPSDIAPVQFEPHSVPSGVVPAQADVVGRTTAAPVRAGEPITDVRLVSGSLLAGYPGTVAAPVRIGDPGAVSLLRTGDRIDVLAADPQDGGQAAVVASHVPVIALPATARSASGLVTGGLIVVAVPEETARTLAGAGVSAYLSIVISR